MVEYGLISVIVCLFTISRWKITEKMEMKTPVGDLEFFEFSYGYSLTNLIFFPSIVICEVYKLICRIFD